MWFKHLTRLRRAMLFCVTVAIAGSVSCRDASATTMTRTFYRTSRWEPARNGAIHASSKAWASEDGLRLVTYHADVDRWVFWSLHRRKILPLNPAVEFRRDHNQETLQVELPLQSHVAIPLDLDAGVARAAIDGDVFEVRRASDIIGEVDCRALLESITEMQRHAGAYEVNPEVAQTLGGLINRPGTEITLYFGTWCERSIRDAPKLLKVAQVSGAMNRLRCYGVGPDVATDPVAQAVGLKGVPAALLVDGGGNRSFLSATDLIEPMRTLKDLLTAGQAAPGLRAH